MPADLTKTVKERIQAYLTIAGAVRAIISIEYIFRSTVYKIRDNILVFGQYTSSKTRATRGPRYTLDKAVRGALRGVDFIVSGLADGSPRCH